MNNKKGFTLIEILTVIIILGLITAVAIFAISGLIGDKEVEVSDTFKNTIFAANSIYMTENQDKYIKNEGTVYCITIKELVDSGNLSSPVIDPVLNTELDLNVFVEAKIVNGLYEYNIKNECTQILPDYTETILNGADPEILNGMIAIEIEGNSVDNQVVKIADLSSDWYSYEDQRWANTVLVTSESRDTYLNASPGDIVNQDDILAYYVWVPRFEYVNTTEVSDTEIKFVSKDVTKKSSDVVGEWNTSDSFTQNGSELNGIWVAKYDYSSVNQQPLTVTNSNLPSASDLVLVPSSNYVKVESDTTSNFNNIITNMTMIDTFGLSSAVSSSFDSEIDVVKILTQSVYGANGTITGDNSLFDTTNSTTGNITGVLSLESVNFTAEDFQVKVDNLEDRNQLLSKYECISDNKLAYVDLALETGAENKNITASDPVILGFDVYPKEYQFAYQGQLIVIGAGVGRNSDGAINKSEPNLVYIGSLITKGVILATDTNGEGLSFQINDATSIYGEIDVDASTGEFIYEIDNNKVMHLNNNADGISESFTFTVTNDSGYNSELKLNFEILGTNDKPELSISSTETANAIKPNISIFAETVDPDNGATHTYKIVGDTVGTYGTLAVNETTGEYTYEINASSTAYQNLTFGQVAVETFTIEVEDEFDATDTTELKINVSTDTTRNIRNILYSK